MSDPTMNREIEDVLSSIRRLVSQDRAQVAGSRVDAPAPAGSAPAALVLTPALRVVEAGTGPGPGAIHGGEAPEGAPEPASEPAEEEAIGFDSGRIHGDMVLAALGAVGPIGMNRRADDALDQAGGWSRGRAGTAEPEATGAPFGGPVGTSAADEISSSGAERWQADAAADSDDRALADDLASLESTIAELEAAVAGIDEEFEVDGGEAGDMTVAEGETLWPVAETEESPAAAEETVAEEPEAGVLVAEAEAWAAEAEMQAPEAGAEDAPYGDSGPVPADDADAHPASPEAEPPRRLHLAAENRSEDEAAEMAGIAQPHPAEDVPETSRARIFVRRAATVESDARPEPEPWPAAAADGAAEPFAQPSAEPTAATQPASHPAPSAEVDLETLRRLVSEVLRQELRGALGERITQNVRKLVRREIHRALDSRDFE